jgi:hypothetical protein
VVVIASAVVLRETNTCMLRQMDEPGGGIFVTGRGREVRLADMLCCVLWGVPGIDIEAWVFGYDGGDGGGTRVECGLGERVPGIMGEGGVTGISAVRV